jgi:hypothetical protein
MTMGLGAHTFTTQTGKAYITGQAILITATASPTNYMEGTVTSYSTNQIVINITAKTGSGTYSQWALHSDPINLRSDTGRFIVTSVTGTWTSNVADTIRVGIIDIAIVDNPSGNPVTQISILQGGNYQFVQHNFLANSDSKKLYGCDALNRAFEFDGDVYIPIRTQITIDAPTTIAAVNGQLALSYFGAVVFSAVGNPHDFRTTSLGFADIHEFGDTVTGMSPIVGGVLAVACRDSFWQVSIDTQTGNYKAELISPDIGAIHYGLMNLGALYSFDDKGIIRIVPSYVFGGFEHDTISRAIQPVIDRFREKIVATAVYKSKNQVRFYANDGTGIIMTMTSGVTQTGAATTGHDFSQFTYPINVSYAWSGEDASGRDIVLLGDEDGYVYVANTGSSFDGEPIQAYIRTAFNNVKSPSAIKRFRKIEVELSTVGYSYIRFNPDFSYADPSIATHLLKYEELQGAGGYWDEAIWNEFYYDGKIVSQPEIRIQGSGTNIGLVVFSNSAIDLGHNLSGIVLHYTPRKLNR